MKYVQQYGLTGLLLLLFSFTQAQQVTPWVLANAGNETANGGYHLSWTLGEPAIVTLVQPEAALLQGFQQPNYLFDVLVEDPDGGYSFRLYPNPTSHWITIEIDGFDEPLTAFLYDPLGRLVFQKDLTGPCTELDLGQLPGATYILKALNRNNEVAGAWRVQKVW